MLKIIHSTSYTSVAVVKEEKATGFGVLLRKLPPVAFTCIYEAHSLDDLSRVKGEVENSNDSAINGSRKETYE